MADIYMNASKKIFCYILMNNFYYITNRQTLLNLCIQQVVFYHGEYNEIGQISESIQIDQEKDGGE